MVLWVPAFAGMTGGGERIFEWKESMLAICKYTLRIEYYMDE